MARSDSLTIVAIPSEDDYVWKISSEKVPHLTLLFLGDQSENPNVYDMAQYLKHVVDTSMRKFSLQVDRRGMLGSESADVIFFDKSDPDIKNLEQIRSYLLTNPYINTAYNSTEQYPQWTPHLTMGYPATPAKSDNRDYPGISWVTFDRISIWTGDYEGPEFMLKSNDYPIDPVAHSDSVKHFGVKGMHWGVRKSHVEAAKRVGKLSTKVSSISTSTPTKKAFDEKVKSAGGVHKLKDKELKDMLSRLELEKKYVKFKTEDAEKRAEGRKAVLKILGEVGKVALPLVVGAVVANRRHGRATFRTSGFVNKGSVIDGVVNRAIGS